MIDRICRTGTAWCRFAAVVVILLVAGRAVAVPGGEGACCFPDGSCSAIDESECIADGGQFLGHGTSCALETCTGACCLPDGSCVDDAALDECENVGGTYQGFGEVCSAELCPQACCLADGSCIFVLSTDCAAQGGALQGEQDCSVAYCAGACCVDDGTCVENVSPDDCASLGGTYQGFESQCFSGLCPQACCFPDGSCSFVHPETCAVTGGFIQGEQDCSVAYCAGACCLSTGVCQDGLSLEDCIAQGGAYQGFMTTCAASICLQACCYPDGTCEFVHPETCAVTGGQTQLEQDCAVAVCGGACCLSDGSCVNDSSLDECESGGGTYQGYESVCVANLCPQACCLVDGTCVSVTVQDCEAIGGVPQGLGEPCGLLECPVESQPGWNWLDNQLTLTGDQPVYWSAMTGQPAGGGLSPFTALDPGFPPGRPANDGTNERVLRGYIVGWAVNDDGEEIRWNHLLGNATIINYHTGRAWEYGAYTVPVVNDAVANGEQSGTPGVIDLDGLEYAQGFDYLMLNFAASGSTSFSGPALVITDTDLTLHPIDVDVRQATDGPVTTKASFTVWNQNEVKFSGAHRCVTCWDQTLLSQYDLPNHFLVQNLQTAHGTARIDGHAAPQCNVFDDPSTPEDESVTSVEASLLGVAARYLTIDGGIPCEANGFEAHPNAASGSNLVGLGAQSARIRFDVLGGGGEAEAWPETPEEILDRLERAAGIVRTDDDAPSRDALPRIPTSGVIGERRPSVTEKGSLVIFSKVELRWEGTAPYAPIQDTFISLTNDVPDDVDVLMYFINGDPPVGP